MNPLEYGFTDEDELMNKPNNDMPDVIYIHGWDILTERDSVTDKKYFSESHIQQLEARHQAEMDSALAKQREKFKDELYHSEEMAFAFKNIKDRRYFVNKIFNATPEEGNRE